MTNWGEIDRTRPGVPVDIVIGDENAQHLIIRLLCRSHPDHADYWDGNWIDSKVHVVAGPFQGEYRAQLRSDEFEDFHRQLVGLDPKAEGKALFGNLDGWLNMTVKGDGEGRLTFHGWASVEMHTSSLEFEFPWSADDLTRLVRDIERGLEMFPVVGRP